MGRRKGRFEKKKVVNVGIFFAVFLVMCVFAGMLGLFVLKGNSRRQEGTELSVSETEIPACTIKEMTVRDHYMPILEKYRRAIGEGWSADQCEIEGISPRMQAGADCSKVGYAYRDLDDDGREELLIAEEALPHIDYVRDLYTTLEDGTPIQLWVDDGDSNHCYLYEGNIIGTEYTTKTEAEYCFYTLESGQLLLRESLEYEDEDTVVHIGADGSTRPVTAREAMDITYAYNHMKLDLTWIAEDPDGFLDTDSIERYLPVLEVYQTALLEKWDFEQCQDNDICYLVSWLAETPEQLGVYYMNLDSDSVQELLILNVEDSTIYDMYTLKDGKPRKLLSGGERNHYVLSTYNHIINRGSGSAFMSVFRDYVLYEGELVLVESVITDYQKDPENPWFRSPDGESLGQPLTEQEANEIFNGFETARFAAKPIL